MDRLTHKTMGLSRYRVKIKLYNYVPNLDKGGYIVALERASDDQSFAICNNMDPTLELISLSPLLVSDLRGKNRLNETQV